MDQEDVESVLAGDDSAFEHIVRRWQGPLIQLAYRFCHDRGRAEDMAQEAFLRAFRNLKSWRRESTFSTWLFALATNLYCTELRKHPPLALPFEDIHEPQDPADLDRNLEQRNRDRMVRKAVQSLPAKYREALTLYYFHELDLPAAAHSLGLPEGTMKAHLYRARNLLREKLKAALSSPAPSTSTAANSKIPSATEFI